VSPRMPGRRWAIPAHYQLSETPSPDHAQRTEWNVRDSCGTVIFSIACVLIGGSKQTAELSRQHRKPCLHLARERDEAVTARKLREFLAAHQIRVMNVAGPRQSQEPEVARFVSEILERSLQAAEL
jgi:hypothetical protein